MKKLLILCAFAFLNFNVYAHDGEDRIVLEPEVTMVSAGRVVYKFQLLDTEAKKVLGDPDLKISHEKKLHLLAYDPSLQEFQHVHPLFDGEFWTVELNFIVNGDYTIWAQGELASDGDEFSVSSRLSVSKGKTSWPAPPVLTDIRSNEDKFSVASLDKQKLHAGRHTMMTLFLSRSDGSTPVLTPYLGAFAHVIAVSADGNSLIHIHPMSGETPDQGMLHVTFPNIGFYRIWIQFVDREELKTIPLSVQVF